MKIIFIKCNGFVDGNSLHPSLKRPFELIFFDIRKNLNECVMKVIFCFALITAVLHTQGKEHLAVLVVQFLLCSSVLLDALFYKLFQIHFYRFTFKNILLATRYN